MDFLKLVNKYEDDLVKDLVKLLQIDTVAIEQPEVVEAPFGENLKNALEHVLALGESFGFKTKNIDNIAGHIEYGEGEEIVAVLSHIDVVPAGDGWKYPPFSGTIEGDKIYARGALDDKGSLMSSIYALKMIADSGVKLNKRIRLIFGTDEESGSRGVKRYLKVEEKPTMGFSPDANFPLIYGEKGIMSINISTTQPENSFKFSSGTRHNLVPEVASLKTNNDLAKAFNEYCEANKFKGKVEGNNYTLYGKSSHAMEPEKGINALVNLASFLKEHTNNELIKFIANNLTDTRFNAINENFTDKEMGDLTVNVAIANINEKGGNLILNLRYPINWDKEKFLKNFKTLGKDYHLNVEVISDSVPHYVDPNSELVKTLHNAYIKYTNDTTSKLQTIGGGTYARELGNAVAFGMLMPGREDVVHRVDEFIYISDLLTSTAIFAEAIYQLGK